MFLYKGVCLTQERENDHVGMHYSPFALRKNYHDQSNRDYFCAKLSTCIIF